jgi:anti-anti-sigma factor
MNDARTEPAPPGYAAAAPRDLTVDVERGIPAVVRIGGELDMESAPRLRDELLCVIRRYGPRLALDLGAVRFLDCAGLNALLATRRRAHLEGGWVQVVRGSAQVRRIIALLGLEQAFGPAPVLTSA